MKLSIPTTTEVLNMTVHENGLMTIPAELQAQSLPIGGCISELNCIYTRSKANEDCIRDTQQHLRDYGVLIEQHKAQSDEVRRLREALTNLLLDEPSSGVEAAKVTVTQRAWTAAQKALWPNAALGSAP